MSTAFSRTLETLELEQRRSGLPAVVGGVLLLGLWTAWFFAAPVEIRAVSSRASVEVSSAAHRVYALLGGRVRKSNLQIGQRVRRGEALVELDGETEILRAAEEDARAQSIGQQLAKVAQELAATEAAAAEADARGAALIEETKSRLEEAHAAWRLAQSQTERQRRLQADGLSPEADLLKAVSEADQRRAARDALQNAVARLSWDHRSQHSVQQAQVQRLGAELAGLNGQMETARSAAARWRYEAEKKTLLAPVDGVVAECLPLTPGAVVRDNELLATVVPDSAPRIVAYFPVATSLGRIAEGQPGLMRLDGFPWVEFGTVRSRVARVAGEARAGLIRVELDVQKSRTAVPLQHGLTGTVEVAVQRLTPAQLVLRKAGLWLGPHPARGAVSAAAPANP